MGTIAYLHTVNTMEYTLELNRTRLLFIPSLDPIHDPNLISGVVVQVSVRGDLEDGDAFSVAQASITTAIETLLVGHETALLKLPKCVVIKDVIPGYTLMGLRKPWKYGYGKKFCLGNNILQSAEQKWIFRFEKSK